MIPIFFNENYTCIEEKLETEIIISVGDGIINYFIFFYYTFLYFSIFFTISMYYFYNQRTVTQERYVCQQRGRWLRQGNDGSKRN